MRAAALGAGVLVLAACATVGGGAEATGENQGEVAARLAGATFGRVPGQPVSCVTVAELTRNRALGSELVLFEAQGGRLYANRIQNCPALAYERSVRLAAPTARLCRGEKVEVLDKAGAAVLGTCAVGDFLTYEPRR